MTYSSEHLMDDYSRISIITKADRLMMIKLMYEESKIHSGLIVPSMVFDPGDYPDGSAGDMFTECIISLCEYWGFAKWIDITPELEEKWKNRDCLFMLIDFHCLRELKLETRKQKRKRGQLREFITTAFNTSYTSDPIASEWSEDNDSLLVVDNEFGMDFNDSLKHILALFRDVKEILEEWK